MKSKPKKPVIPPEKHDTVRHEIQALLSGHDLSAKDISMAIGIPEKEVYDHLDHVRLMLRRSGAILLVVPASCRKCGFVFSKRNRLTKPGRCPVCRGEQIEEPRFSVS